MSKSRPVETKITDAVSKLNQRLGDYFKKQAETHCAKIKTADERWFTDTLTEVVDEFRSKSADQLATLLDDYRISERVADLEHANSNLRVLHPWNPSRDPEKDVRAHLLSVKKTHLSELSVRVNKMNAESQPILKDLENEKRVARDELTQVRLLAMEIHKLTTHLQTSNNCSDVLTLPTTNALGVNNDRT